MITGSEHGYPDPFVYTSSGERFYINNPTFNVGDIAHALANNCRFNGHIRFPFSVAQHSINVAIMAELFAGGYDSYVALDGLMHDASEAYLSDVPSPFKQLLPDWKKIDKQVEGFLRASCGLTEDKSDFVKKADWYALFIEANELLGEEPCKNFEDPHNFREEALAFYKEHRSDVLIIPSDHERDRRTFLNMYNELTTELKANANFVS